MKTVSVTAYETYDGKRFTDQKEAIEHENRLRRLRYFLIYKKPDLTEGRHDAQPCGYITVDAVGLSYFSSAVSDEVCREYAEAWCETYISARKYAFAACSFHGGRPFHNWKVEQIPTYEENEYELLKEFTEKYKLLGSVDGSGFKENTEQ